MNFPISYSYNYNSNFSYVALCVNVGSINENNNNKGIAHLIEHIIFKNNNINNSINSHGMKVNAFTSQFNTVYHILSKNDFIHIAIQILLSIVLFPKFSTKNINDEKKIVINEILQRSTSPIHNIYTKSYSTIFPNNNNLHYEIAGYINTINKITKKNISQFYKKYYKINNMFLFINSSIPKNILQSITNFYSQSLNIKLKYKQKLHTPFINNIKYISYINTPNTFNIIQNSNSISNSNNKHIYTLISFTFNNNLSNKELATIEILNKYLTGSLTSILFIKLREQKKLIYNIQSNIENLFSFIKFNILFSTSNNPYTQKDAINTILNTIFNLKKNNIPTKQFNKFKLNTIISYKYKQESYSYHLDNALYNNYKYNTLSQNNNIHNEINNVSQYDIKKLIKKYFNKKNLFIIQNNNNNNNT